METPSLGMETPSLPGPTLLLVLRAKTRWLLPPTPPQFHRYLHGKTDISKTSQPLFALRFTQEPEEPSTLPPSSREMLVSRARAQQACHQQPLSKAQTVALLLPSHTMSFLAAGPKHQ